jgi:S1-C subfamily serine protease
LSNDQGTGEGKMKLRILVIIALGLSICAVTAKPTSEYTAVIKKAAPAVVNISAEQIVEKSPLAELFGNPLFGFGEWNRQDIEKSLGSGVIVNAEGIVITCHHVVRNARAIKVKLQDNSEYGADVVTVDEINDLAVLRLTGKKPAAGFPVMVLGDSDALEDGDRILAIGNAFGLGKVVSSGIISNRSLRVMGKRLVVTDAPINPGNSGGALVDMEAKLIAIPNAIFSKSGASHGVGFAIPINLVRAVIESFDKGQAYVMRPWTGITVQDIEPAIAESLEMGDKTGVIVQAVHPLSPAYKASLARGDIITHVNGDTILDRDDFQFRLQTVAMTATVTLKIMKSDHSEKEISFAPIMPPEKPAADATEIQGKNPLNGVTIANLSPAMAVQLGIDANQEDGVVITKVGSSPVARLLGIKEGDIIIALNERRISDVKDLQQQLKRLQRFGLTLKRQQQILNLQIQ